MTECPENSPFFSYHKGERQRLKPRSHCSGLRCPSADPEVGTGGPDIPPGKSQIIWVSIGNQQLPPPLEKVGPPPPWKMLDTLCSGTLKNDRFL